VAGVETDIVVAAIGLAGGVLLEWVRARSARSTATLRIADNRERRLQAASEALVDDYRRRLADAYAEIEREAKRRRELARECRRVERRRRHERRRHRGGAG
jgi:hypothetical protein